MKFAPAFEIAKSSVVKAPWAAMEPAGEIVEASAATGIAGSFMGG
jgi:hypothetical protein